MSQTLEYVARHDGDAGPRGTVVSAAAWAKLSDHAREDFAAREVRKTEPPAKER